MSDRHFKYAFFIVISAIIIVFIFKGRTSSDKIYLNELESKVTSLNAINTRLEEQNSKIITDLALKMDSISVLEGEVAEIEYKKILLAKYYERKIKDIDRLNVIELDSAFSARYR